MKTNDKQKFHGLTTTKASFIENAQNEGQMFIHQPYELYSNDNQEAWKKLYALLLPKWECFANAKFMEGIRCLCLKPNRIPTLEEVNVFLEPLTGFKAKAVSGYVPTFLFFDSLKRREFPTTITIRDSQKLNYLPEPDIFHDIAGHVPMHTNKAFAVESFEHLYEEVRRLEEWLVSGKLDNVSPGEPKVSENDLQVFLQDGNRGADIK